MTRLLLGLAATLMVKKQVYFGILSPTIISSALMMKNNANFEMHYFCERAEDALAVKKRARTRAGKHAV